MATETINKDAILDALKVVKDPDLNKDIVSLGFVKDIKTCDGTVSFTIELTTPACPVKEQLKREAEQAVMGIPDVKKVDVTMTSQVRPTLSEQKSKLIPQVKNIIPVASGKGGVGKSTVSANLAVALSKLGAKVGLMDADMYGPSIPMIMGALKAPPHKSGKLTPVMAHGVKFISMGFFIPKGDAVIWRGPMLHKSVEQFLGTVEWGELDYLIVDLPPGTGDIQLSLCQLIPLTGAAVVSTPQDVAMNIAEKAIIMFGKLRTPVLGLIENMSGYTCSKCGQHEDIFGSEGTKKYSMKNNIPFLGAIPLSTNIRLTSDSGQPIVASDPDSPAAKAFMEIAKNLAAQVSIKANEAATSKDATPTEINQFEKDKIKINWRDGHESIYPARLLRLNCACATCIDEMTGKKILRDEIVPKDIYPLDIKTVGNYAFHFQWSDGHSTGIYTYERLRQLCPCCSNSGTRT